MTPRTFFSGKVIILSVLLIMAFGFWRYSVYISSIDDSEVSELSTQENLGDMELPIFTWEFEYEDMLGLDTYPKTNIFLEAKYYEGKTERKFIDTVTGSCNVSPDSESDSLPGSDNIQCYYAGLGYRFKITRGEDSYFVQRKMFEEGSPDYNPPVYKYEVVLKF